jgi:hypothetical protein
MLKTHPDEVEPQGQELVEPLVPRNPPKLQSSFAKASDFAEASPDSSEDTRTPPRSGDRGSLRRRVDSPWPLFPAMLGARDDLILKVPAQAHKVIAVSRHAHDEILVLLRVQLGGPQRLG